MYMSDVNQKGKSFKNGVSIYLMQINTEKVLEFRDIYVRCQSTKKKS